MPELTKRVVDQTERDPARDVFVWDTEVKGFGLRVLPSGKKTFVFQYRRKGDGKSRRKHVGDYGALTVKQARDKAAVLYGQVRGGGDPIGEERAAREAAAVAGKVAAVTVSYVLDLFLERYVKARRMRSAYEIERALNYYVRPAIGAASIYELRRSRVAEMLDKIEDENGAVTADRVLAYVRKAFNWYATRDDAFNSPIVKGMGRTRPAEHARTRVLSDEEIRDLWRGLDKMTGPFPAIVRMLLLVGQRKGHVTGMRRREINGLEWTLPRARNMKLKLDSVVPLSEPVRAIIDAQPLRLDARGRPDRNGDYVFSRTGKEFSNFGRNKLVLDRHINKIRAEEGRGPMPAWIIHDLRRTSRTLMSRAGVLPDIGERAQSRKIQGVRGVYDRFEYLEEKRDALDRLAALVLSIVAAGENASPHGQNGLNGQNAEPVEPA